MKIVSASIYQKRFWIAQKLNPQSNAYNLDFTFIIKGNLNIDIFFKSIKTIINKFDLGKSYFKEEDEELKIVISENVVHQKYLFFFDIENNKKSLEKILSDIANKPFNLSEIPLFRLALIKLSFKHYIFIGCFHHIILDGKFLTLFINDLSIIYNKLINKEKNINDLNLTPSIENYLNFEKSNYNKKQKQLDINYWLNLIENDNLNLQFHKIKNTKIDSLNHSNSKYFILDKKTTQNILSIVKQENTSFFIFFSAIWGVLLSRYFQQKNIFFTYAVNIRPNEFYNLYGCFINNILMKISLNNNITFKDLIKNLKLQRKESRKYQRLPYDEILNALRKLSLSNNNSNVALVEAPLRKNTLLKLNGLDIEPLLPNEHNSINDLILEYELTDNIIDLRITYDSDIFKKPYIEQLITHFKLLVEKCIENVETQIFSFPLLTDEEEQKILVGWNVTDTTYPKHKSIHQLLEEQVKKTPDNIAVVFETNKLTYRELNERANQLAHIIQKTYNEHFNEPVKADTLIGIYIDRSCEMIIGILGILKTGAAYVPFDKADPSARLKFKISDCNCKIILTSSKNLKNLSSIITSNIPTICIDNDSEIILKAPKANLNNINNSSDLAYLIYTSGSTGNPKGVMIEHKGVCNLVYDRIKRFNIQQNEKVLQFASINFDASVEIIFLTLLSGASLYIANDDLINNPINLFKYIKEKKLSICSLVPSVLDLMPKNLLPSLKTLIVAGEVCPKDLMNFWSHDRRIYNAYGPTENTVCTTIFLYDSAKSNINIGKPIQNVKCYVLDSFLNPVPYETPGELCISGESLARGYINLPQFTKEKFINNPFVTDEEKKNGLNLRLFKTGDIVSWLPDGNLEFIGRVDNQIKIRGFRVELGEIESQLSKHELISQCAVVAFEDRKKSEKYLAAYYTSKPGFDILNNVLKNYLVSKLPDYMVPSYFIEINAMPLNTSGKIDRKSLPKPDRDSIISKSYVAPRNETEKILTEIWCEILNLNKVGVTDNFFNIGGHSLNATQVVSRISKRFKIDCPIRAIFDHQTIGKLAEFIIKQQKGKKNKNIKIPTVKRNKHITLSFAQERLWFLYEYQEGKGTEYNITFGIKLKGDLNISILEKTFCDLFKRHESLRTIFKKDLKAKPYQIILPYKGFKLNVEEVSKETYSNIIDDETNHVFNLENGPLIKIKLLKMTKDEHILIINQHHIVSDGWSLDIMFNEINELYNAYLENQPINLPLMDIHYADFAAWQRKYLQGKIMLKQLDYWKNKLADFHTLNIPIDKPRPKRQTFKGDSYCFELGKELAEKLYNLAEKKDATLFMVMVTVFNILLHRYTGQKDIMLGTGVANRNWIEIENIIGFFVNILVIRNKLDENYNFNSLIDEVKETCLKAYANQDVPFEYLIDHLGVERLTDRMPLIQNLIVLQNANTKTQLSLKGLKAEPLNYKAITAKFDLTFFLTEKDNKIEVEIEYNTDIYNNYTIMRMAEHFKSLLSAIIENPNTKISELHLLSQQEYDQVVYGWNQTYAPYPKDKTIHELFEEQVKRTPDNIALEFNNITLTYNELNQKANQIAHTIRDIYHDHCNEPVKGDTLIGIYIERSFEMIIGVLGILKSGAAYVPFDTKDPEKRLKFKINDSSCKMILTSSMNKKKLISLEDSKIFHMIIDDFNNELSKASISNPMHFNKPSDLAYVIYTSGSTGQPKGVMIEHYGICNLANYVIKKFSLKQKDKVLQFASFCFDAFVYEWIGTLTCGARLVLLTSEEVLSISEFGKIIESKKINIAMLPPNVLSSENEINLPELKTIVSGGDVCHENEVNKWGKKRRFINAYGPTEITVACTMKDCHPGETISIGKAIQNKKLYVLDKNLKPVPIGIFGELYVGGDGLARSYLNREHITKKRFIENPFVTDEERKNGLNLRLFKTGDIVRWLSDGNLDFFGRADNQVKIHGFRIELAEIETQLSKFESINQCVVGIHWNEKDKTKFLVAYYTLQEVVTKNKNINENFVNTWKELYDETYKKSDITGKLNTFDIAGWNSSYTGKPIPKNQMQEWVNMTVKRILNFKIQNVFEIGIGTGLLMYPLYSHCKKYMGIDFSSEVIDKLQSSFKSLSIKNVDLFKARADEIDGLNFLNNEKIDTVILNSIVQYFPDINYLEDILVKSINLIDSGRIFIGDVRDYRLLNEFHLSVGMYKSKESNFNEVYKKILAKAQREKELLISPEYFICLSEKISEISYVELLPKRGKRLTEMNCYRYDVILHIDNELKPPKMDIDWIAWDNKINIKKELSSNKDYVAIKNYPNKRVWNSYKINSVLEKNEDNYKEKFKSFKRQIKHYLSIEKLYELAEKHNYKLEVSLSLSGTDPNANYNLLFHRKANDTVIKTTLYFDNKENRSFSKKYYNEPITNFKTSSISSEFLRNYLLNFLPDYMVPSYFIELNKMPLNTNGKIDRNALPQPDTDSIISKSYVAPRNETENRLAKIWCEVLKLNKAGVNDNFFNIGGHSLNATQVVSRISKYFKINCPIKAIFDHQTIEKLAEFIIKQQKGKKIKAINIPAVKRNKQIPLSFAQQRLWFLYEYQGGRGIEYNMTFGLKLKGNLKVSILEKTFCNLFKRHETLRTIFKKDLNGKAYQIILPYKEFKLNVEEVSKEPYSNIIGDEINHVFNLGKGPLIRIKLLKIGKYEHILIINQHHIISDGWSIDIMFREINELYNAYLENRPANLPVLDIQYADFAAWQRQYLQGKIMQNQLYYWKNKLADYETLNMPKDKKRPKIQTYNGSLVKFKIEPELTSKLQLLSKETSSTLFMILLTGFYILLNRYSGQNDIVIGSPIANRHYSQLENLLGFFVNTQVLRANTQSKTIMSMIEQVKLTCLEAHQHQDIPFELLVDKLKIKRNQSISPIFQIMFILQNATNNLELSLNDMNVFPIEFDLHTAKFDLTLSLTEMQNLLSGYFEYNTDLYDKSSVQRMTYHYKNILDEMVRCPDKEISKINILSELEYNQIIYDWNQTEAPYPKDKTIHQLFEEQVKRTPDNIAVVFKNKKLTYEELNQRANQLANYIRMQYTNNYKEELNPDTLIAICVERCIEMIIGILGILKAGAAYVPLDPNYPANHIKFILKDTQANFILTLSSLSKIELFKNHQVILLNDWNLFLDFSLKNPNIINKENDLAYVMYTSGSTGKPKGVLQQHRTIVNLIHNTQRTKKIEKTMQFASFIFDVSIQEIFYALFFGRTFYLASSNTKQQLDKLVSYVVKNNINEIFLPTALLNTFMEQSDGSDLNNLKEINIAGEELKCTNGLKKFLKKNTWIDLINQYGPTETHVVSEANINLANINNLTIGRQIANIKLYVLSNSLNLQPIGVLGELYIGGIGLARGYLNRPGLTKKRFIENPFVTDEDKVEGRNLRLYKTGDLVSWLPDGNLKFIGRDDNQVKIRGFRIELAEIETQLSKHESVKQCVVTAVYDRKKGEKYLTVYYTINAPAFYKRALAKQTDPDYLKNELRDYLALKLPDYMVPSYFIELNKMPLNTNGKIDRNALPQPDTDSIISKSYVAPRNETENRLAKIWCEVLKLNKAGVNDNFFNIGGHSLLAMQLVSKINRKFSIDLSVAWIFNYNIIEKQAKYIDGKEKFSINFINDLKLAKKDSLLPKEIRPDYKNNEFFDHSNFKNILLTGATGFLGSHLLAELLNKTNAVIYCLVLPNKDKLNILDMFKEKLNFFKQDYLFAKFYKRIKVINGNLKLKKLGLSRNDYDFLSSNIDVIYHCGANVNHIYNYQLLRQENTLSTLELIKISFKTKPKSLNFISTIGTISEPNKDENFVSYEPYKNFHGYILSKWASERLMIQAFERGLDGTILRLGNIWASVKTGAMSNPDKNTSMLLLRSYIKYGYAPDCFATFEAFPVNTLSTIIVNIASNNDNFQNSFNLLNPKSIAFSEYIELVSKIFNVKIKIIPFEEWDSKILKRLNYKNVLFPVKSIFELMKNFPVNSKLKTQAASNIIKKYNLQYPNYEEIISKTLENIKIK